MAKPEQQNPKYLAVLLKDYPFEKGENYFHLELQFLQHHFERVLLFSDHRPAQDSVRKFSTPSNVDVFNIAEEHPANAPLKLLTDLNSYKDISNGNKGHLVTKLRAQHSYQKRSSSMIGKIKEHMDTIGVRMSDAVWYSYWCDDLAFSIATMKANGLIERAYSRTHSHDIYEGRHPANFLPYRQFIFSQLTNVLCVSGHGRDYLKDRYPVHIDKFAAERLGVINQEPLNSNIAEGPVKLLSISRIAEVKRLEMIIEVLSHTKSMKVDWHHVGASGKSDYEKSVRALAYDKLHHSPNITYDFHGFVPPESVLDKIRELNPHFLINTSTFEGIPVSMMEACSLGIPIIGPNVCGVPEIVEEGYNGFLFDSYNPSELTQILARVEKLTEREYQQLRQNAKSMQESRFDAAKNYSQFASILKGELQE